MDSELFYKIITPSAIWMIFLLLISPTFILFLQKMGFYKKLTLVVPERNKLFYNHMTNSLSTPSSFGMLVLPIGLYFAYLEQSYVYLLVFLSMWLLGLYDDYVKFFQYEKRKFWGISSKSKLFIQTISVFALTVMAGGNYSLFWVIALGMMMIFLINAYNITDGLDGLVSSVSIAAMPVLLFAELFRERPSNNFLILYSMTTVFLAVFYYFGKRPAQVWLGDSGAMAIGLLFALGFLRYNSLVLVIAYLPFIVEGVSSLIQIISIKFFKRKVFKIAPLHFHLLNSGWSEKTIVTRMFQFQVLCSLAAISFLVFFL